VPTWPPEAKGSGESAGETKNFGVSPSIYCSEARALEGKVGLGRLSTAEEEVEIEVRFSFVYGMDIRYSSGPPYCA
jgi:hypothetical protein